MNSRVTLDKLPLAKKSKFIPANQLRTWRGSLAETGGTLAVVTGTFALLHPGNLTAIREAARQASHVALIVHPDGSTTADSSSATAEGAGQPSAAVRLELAEHLRAVSAVSTCALARAEETLEQWRPFTLVHCLKQNSGDAITTSARRLASRVVDIAPIAGCFTADIQKAIRNRQTPVAVPEAALAPQPTLHDLEQFLNSDTGGRPACNAMRSIAGRPLVTVNGCFDILHLGHARLLALARARGARLLVLVNDDDSVRRYKGAGHPVFPIRFRLLALNALEAVSYTYPFAGDNPLELLALIKPDIHIKGGSFEETRVEDERRLVESWGGRLEIVPLVPGFSSSAIVGRMAQTQRPTTDDRRQTSDEENVTGQLLGGGQPEVYH
ncbi:MAG: adenylyltransferase/cytidyltransferase family protein [Lentisphaerae bacterium]|nr:adenylyltransferase/cytidyltransferase family protein [Lentisphaerota bacterium]